MDTFDTPRTPYLPEVGDCVTLIRRADPDDWSKKYKYIPAVVVAIDTQAHRAEVIQILPRHSGDVVMNYTFDVCWLEPRTTSAPIDREFARFMKLRHPAHQEAPARSLAQAIGTFFRS